MLLRSKIKLAVALILTVIMVIIVAQNTQLMTTQFLFWELTLSRSLTMMIVFLGGILTGTLLTLFMGRRRRKTKVEMPAAVEEPPGEPKK